MPWQPYREPLRTTLIRTTAISIAVGAALAIRFHALEAWPIAAALTMWFSFGGHWVELAFLNVLRPRLPEARAVQLAARLAVWFAGGVGLGLGVVQSMRWLAITRAVHTPPWWAFGAAFIGVELIAHVPLALRGRHSLYDGLG